ncbi:MULTISPECIES: hypothetical protein [Aerosakkonema]|uniref:hypothetical protein n=1 Tax=Aerosakkonema TaxID=1246629 RepID=UPI0035BA638D
MGGKKGEKNRAIASQAEEELVGRAVSIKACNVVFNATSQIWHQGVSNALSNSVPTVI